MKKATRRTVAALVVALGLGAGLPAMAATLTTSAKDELRLWVSGRTTEAKLQGNDIFGPDIQLTRYGTALRGRAFQAPVNLGWKEGLVTGQLGTSPVRLEVNRAGQGVNAKGLFAGQISDLHVEQAAISGRVGHCSYDLKPRGDHYEGFRVCGGRGTPIPTTLQLPQGMAAMDDAQSTAILSIFLAR